MKGTSWVIAALLSAGASAPAESQGLVGQIGRFYHDGGWTVFRVGFSRPLGGVIGLATHADYLQRDGGAPGAFAGVGLDVTALRTGAQGPYLVAGFGGGLASPHSRAFSSLWGSWSVGAGYDLMPASFLSVGIETRWREISLDDRHGLELAAGIGLRFGGGSTGKGDRDGKRPGGERVPESTPSAMPSPTSAPATEPELGLTGSAALADSVVEAATEKVGQRYQLGGTGGEGEGFDCSGLIQYAYGRYGVTLPRVSADQARAGREVSKDPAALRPGDLLTFSSGGGKVTHIALFIGNGQFIHSASHGVQISLLSEEDPYGRWWYRRWVGVRRILES